MLNEEILDEIDAPSFTEYGYQALTDGRSFTWCILVDSYGVPRDVARSFIPGTAVAREIELFRTKIPETIQPYIEAEAREAQRTVEFKPKFAGQFETFQESLDTTSRVLTGHVRELGFVLPAVCVDTLGRRCSVRAYSTRARDENTFPVRYFFEMEVE